MAKTRTLGSVVAQTAPSRAEDVEERSAPATPPVPAPEPVQPARATSARKVAPVRSTMDLSPEQHAEFQRWATDATLRVGRTVRGQHVLRALVARLMVDERLAEEITQDLINPDRISAP